MVGGAVAEPTLGARAVRDADAVGAEPWAAKLGSFLDHVFVHASSDGSELSILEDAASIWARGLVVFATFGEMRAEMEYSFRNPAAADAVTRVNAALAKLEPSRKELFAIQADITALQPKVSALGYVRPASRDTGAPIAGWSWDDVFLGRGTHRLVAAVYRGAGTADELAFAMGVLSSYWGNALGSTYVNHCVGTTRRLQRFRERLGRNSVGAWIRDGYLPSPSLAKTAAEIEAGGGAAFPADLLALTSNALEQAYDLGQYAPLPDIELGYVRLLRHLRLLDGFRVPDLPTPSTWAPAQEGLLEVQAVLSAKAGSYPGPSNGAQQTGSPGSAGSEDKRSDLEKAACGLLEFITWPAGLIYWIGCVIYNAADKKGWTGSACIDNINKFFGNDHYEGANTSYTGSALTAQDDKTSGLLIASVYQLQLQAWEAFDRASTFLAQMGLIYRSDLASGSPLFAQFTSIPAAAKFPLLAGPNPEITFHLPPPGPPENPQTTPSGFPVGADPSALFTASGSPLLNVWRLLERDSQEASNDDLDADRGDGYRCWDITAGTSIHTIPLAVEVLTYDGI